MAIRCLCQACTTQFKVDDQYGGKKAKCPKCGQVVVIPAASADGSATAAGPAPLPAPLPATAARPGPAAEPTAGDRTVDLPAGFPMIETEGSPVSGIHRHAKPSVGKSAAPVGSAISSRRPARRPSDSKKLWMMIGGSAAALILLIVVIVVVAGSGDKNQRGAAAGPSDKNQRPTVVFHWPPDERRDAKLEIDGKKHEFSLTDDVVQLELEPGDHTLVIWRRGFEPYEDSLTLEAGEKENVTPTWKSSGPSFVADQSGFGSGAGGDSGIEGYQDWLQNVDRAVRLATEQQKDILIAFVASDWDDESEQLQQDVFATSEFRDEVAAGFVPVVIDLPLTEEGYNQLHDPLHNRWAKREYSISEVPTLVLCDSSGKPYAREEGYLDDGPAAYLRRFHTLKANRDQRDRLLAAVRESTGAAQFEAALQAARWMTEADVAQFFVDEVQGWTALAREHDPNNEQGRHEILFEVDWLARLQTARADGGSPKLQAIIDELDQWKGPRQFHDANRAARLHLAAAVSLDAAHAVKYIDAALACNPTDAELVSQLKIAKEVLAHADLAGTGTGFLVAPSGYILTNHHVIEGPGRIEVLLPQTKQRVAAQLIADDAERDIALIKIDLPAEMNVAPLPIAESQAGRGVKIAVFGFPLGDQHGDELKLAVGTIGGLPNPASEGMYLLNCQVNPGNSGGPLCDQQGRVVGMVTAKTFGGDNVDSYGMAIPSGDLAPFLAKNVPDYAVAETVLTEAKEWAEVDPVVSPSVMMILKLTN